MEFLFQAISSLTRFMEGNNPSVLKLTFAKYPDAVEMMVPIGKIPCEGSAGATNSGA